MKVAEDAKKMQVKSTQGMVVPWDSSVDGSTWSQESSLPLWAYGGGGRACFCVSHLLLEHILERGAGKPLPVPCTLKNTSGKGGCGSERRLPSCHY